ncbi:MAG: GAF domain-containing protein, partial [Acidobacteria bacterium]|nr:GAF domain-containing protein [Acidobacteriota bacterium]
VDAPLFSPTDRQLLRQEILLDLARSGKTDVSATIRRVTERLSLALRVARVSYWSFSPDGATFVCEDLYDDDRARHENGISLPVASYPAYFEAIRATRLIAADDARRDPRTSEFADGYLEPLGITSMLDVPVFRDGMVAGVLCHEHVGPVRRWKAEEQEFAGSMADMISLAFLEAERKALREELERLLAETRANAARWEGVVSSIAEAVWLVDPSGKVTYANEAARAHACGDVLEPGWDVFRMNGEPLPKAALPAARALAGETVRGFEIRAEPHEGGPGLSFQTSAAPVLDASGSVSGAVLVASDITERVAFDQLRDQFTGVVAHELKTPVTILKGYAETLLASPEGLSAAQLSMLEAIGRGATRIDRIIHALLDVARFDLHHVELSPAPIDLGDVAAEVVADLRRTTSHHEIVFARLGTARLSGDRERLTQVLSNLVGNAIKYSPLGGPVNVTVSSGPGEAQCSVSDRGIGIPEERRAGLFGRFYRAHAGSEHEYGGIGAGLYLAKCIVEA